MNKPLADADCIILPQGWFSRLVWRWIHFYVGSSTTNVPKVRKG